jgi:CDP-glycerol glycerophosphotransferase
VIVPFWSVESYIGACLESLQRQHLADLEVILVDDGSPDGSLAVAEEYVARDPRFRLVRQQNAGLGPARNTGVEHATGEYLTFVDSDDVVGLGAYERAVASLGASGSDFLTFRAARFDNLGVRP